MRAKGDQLLSLAPSLQNPYWVGLAGFSHEASLQAVSLPLKFRSERRSIDAEAARLVFADQLAAELGQSVADEARRVLWQQA